MRLVPVLGLLMLALDSVDGATTLPAGNRDLRLPASPARSLVVTQPGDDGPGSLRQAIADAADGATIEFAVTGEITLLRPLVIAGKLLSLEGPEAPGLAISGGNKVRIFERPPEPRPGP